MKNKTRIPLLEPDLGENELKYLSKCISDNWISSAGPFVEEFEKKIATYAECKFSVATANATSGLYLSLIVAGVKPGDYVIGTGKEHTVEDFAKKAFNHVGLNYKDHIVVDKKLVRPAEVDTLLADYSKAKKILKWEPKTSFDDLIINMVEHDLKEVGGKY